MKQCKLCGNTKLERLAPLCRNMEILGPGFPKAEYDIVACPRCGFVFDSCESVDQKCFDDYYLSSNSKTVNYYDIFSRELAESYFRHIFDSLKSYISPTSSILDVAGGYGELSSYFLSQGYSNITMLDMKRDCAQFAANNGLRVIEGNLFDRPFGGEMYDLILCSHTLEHFIDLDAAMDIMCKALTADGYLYLEIPNVEEYANLERAPYHFLTYEHVCHFSENTIYNLAAQFHMRVVFLQKYVKCEDYPCIYALLQPDPSRKAKRIEYDPLSKQAMLQYVQRCKGTIKEAVQVFETEHTPLILWGIGASTAQLLEQGFDTCNVLQLIDSNRARQGISFQIGGRILSVEGPEKIQNNSATIFILPTAYRKSIEASIRNYGLTNPVASLNGPSGEKI